MTPPDPRPDLPAFTPNPTAQTAARAFAFMLPTPAHVAARLEDVRDALTHHAQQHAGPRLPTPHSAALSIFHFAASGLSALLEDAAAQDRDAWNTLSTARLWALERCQSATAPLPVADVEALHLAYVNAHLFPGWVQAQRRAGRAREAARLAAWWAVCRTLEAVPTLADGEAEDMTGAVLEVFADPDAQGAGPIPGTGEPSSTRGPHTPQYLERLEDGTVNVCMGGGEDYRAAPWNGTLSPLPDGGAFLALTLEGDRVTVRLTPDQAAYLRRAWATLPGEEERGPTSPLN